MLRSEIVQSYRRHVNSGMARLFELMNSAVELSSDSSYLVDSQGAQYLDCGGYCVFLLGHRHPAIVSAVKAQLEKHPVSSRVLINGEQALAAKALANVAPDGLEYVWFGSSGSEVVDASLKLAAANGNDRFISAQGGFHGKTIGALSVTGRTSYRKPFQNILNAVDFVPYGDADAIDTALRRQAGPATVILEPLQSEAGVIVPPPGYLKDVSDLCKRYDAILIFDEISTGMGRTGRWWRCESEDVEPDVLLAGKTLGGGVLAVSALIANEKVFGFLNREPLLHTSTFSGSPIACAAARAAVETIRAEKIPSVAHSLGTRLLGIISTAVEISSTSIVEHVRGVGLLLGIEFSEEHYAADFMLEMMHRKILVSHSLNAHRVVRLTPPATLVESDIELIGSAVRESLLVVEARFGNKRRRGVRYASS